MPSKRKQVVPPPSTPRAEAPEIVGYGELLDNLKQRIRAAQVRAALSVNRELVSLYWDIGRAITERQVREGRGASVIERLARDLQAAFPKVKGFSRRNLWRMRALYQAYAQQSDGNLPQAVAETGGANLPQAVAETGGANLPQAVAETGGANLPQAVAETGGANLPEAVAETGEANLPQAVAEIRGANLPQAVAEIEGLNLPQAVAEIPWGHNIVLLEKLVDSAERLWYARKTLEHGWSRSLLVHHIESGLHRRQGKAVTNFATTLSAMQSDLAAELLKDPYHFDFLQLGPALEERELERALLAHVRDFLLELGVGFALVGSQYRLEVGGQDYQLDLLFYHIRLRCYVVVELKVGAFQPEHAGKMNFYLSAVDDLLRQEGHQPSIGLILCKERNRVVAEYSLRGTSKPIGVAEYRVTDSLPKRLRGSLPSPEELEKELNAAGERGRSA